MDVAILAVVFGAIQTFFTVLLYFQKYEGRTVTRNRNPFGWMVVLTLATWGAVTLDFYDRRHSPTGVIDLKQWDENAKNLKVVNGDLTNRTVPLDGYKLVDCKFGNTILIYEGRKPTEVTCNIDKGALLTLETNNPAVKQTMSIMNMFAASGQISCKGSGSELPLLPGPE